MTEELLISIYKALYQNDSWLGKWTHISSQTTIPFTANEKDMVKAIFDWVTTYFDRGTDSKFTEYMDCKLGSGNCLIVDVDDISFISVRFSKGENVGEYPIRLFIYRRCCSDEE